MLCDKINTDPEVGRFISADSIDYLAPDTVNGLNLYAYCKNNPIMYCDPSGHFPWLVAVAIVAAVIVVSFAIFGGVSAAMSGGSMQDVGIGIAQGTAVGVLLAASVLLVAFGAYFGIGTALGSMVTFYGVTIASNLAEVAVVQGKKSFHDDDDFWNAANDVNRAMYANSAKIVMGETDIISYTITGTRVLPKAFTGSKVLSSYLVNPLSYYSRIPFHVFAGASLLKKANPLFWGLGIYSTARQVSNLMMAILESPDFENSQWSLY